MAQSHRGLPASTYSHGEWPLFSTSPSLGITKRDLLEPYTPPNVPHGLPHVVRFATLSTMDLPVEARFLIIILARFADPTGLASVALDTLCALCRIGSHHTVTRYITMAEEIGILQKMPGQGGKDRQSNKYLFLGEGRQWRALTVGHPDDNPIIVLAAARVRIEELEPQAARVPGLESRVAELEAELARLRNGGAIGHTGVTDGEAASPSGLTPGSYGTAGQAIPGEDDTAIRHSRVTDGPGENHPDQASHSYESTDPGRSQEPHAVIRHSEVTDGLGENQPGQGSHSYENTDPGSSQEPHAAIRLLEVTDGSDEGQEYLARRARVEALVMRHQDYYEGSFDRRGILGAIEYFSRSPQLEEELLRQVRILDAGRNPRAPGTDPPPEPDTQPPSPSGVDRYAVGECPDCGKPFATYGGAEFCTDCTERRRRESEA